MTVEALNADTCAETAEQFGRCGYVIVRRLIDPALAEFFWSYVHTKFASQLLKLGDKLVPDAPSEYGDPAFDGLLEHLRPQIERGTGLGLYPTYSYFRLYKRGDVLRRHRDRVACEISVTLNLGQTPSEPWPIHIESTEGPYRALLGVGDALLYRGSDLYHWRDAYEGDRVVQGFLHYVNRSGPHAGEKFDHRRTLMRRSTREETTEDQIHDKQ